jgi:uncharacterized surface protein with fasciclin (FAS1) repeats
MGSFMRITFLQGYSFKLTLTRSEITGKHSMGKQCTYSGLVLETWRNKKTALIATAYLPLNKSHLRNMKKLIIAAFALAAIAIAPTANAQTKMVGGAAMYPTKNIVENAVNSKDHTTLVAAVKAAGLVETLESAGPFTVFAPTNEAFNKLPKGTVETLVKPENKAALTKILTYHVVSGKLSAAQLMAKIKAGNGTAELTTVSGGILKAMAQGGKIYLVDEKGGKSWVTIADVNQSNGVIHVVNTVLMPN